MTTYSSNPEQNKEEIRALPWWRKDSLGWPIEGFEGKPFKSATRIVFQNIRKVFFKLNKNSK